MAPEQAAGRTREIGPPTDVHALGAILYELLVGSPPFRAPSSLMIVRQVLDQEPVRPRRLDRCIPRELEIICLKCLEKEPGLRYASARELAADLERFVQGKPILAHPLTPPFRFWRWCRRQPALAAVGVLAAIALVAGVAVAYLVTELQSAHSRDLQASRLAAHAAFERSLTFCEQTDASRGMLWLARTLELANHAGAPELARAVRANLASWQCRLHPLQNLLNLPERVSAVGFDPECRLLLCGTEEGKVQLWDVNQGNPLGSLQVEGIVRDVEFRSDRAVFLTASKNVVQLWRTATRQKLGPGLTHEHEVMVGSFSPDGRTLATGTKGGVVQLWDAASGTKIGPPLLHEAEVRAARFNPDGTILLTTALDNLAKLWDRATGKLLYPPIVHDDMLFAAAFSPDGSTFATAGNDSTVRLFDTRTGRRLDRTFRHQAGVYAVTFSPDGRRLLTGGYDATARLWDLERGTPVGTPLHHPDRVIAVAFASDGRRRFDWLPGQHRAPLGTQRRDAPIPFAAAPSVRTGWYVYSPRRSHLDG